MKKLLFAVSVFSFLLIGAITVDATTVYDDPPKKEVKSKKDCSKKCPSSKTCCSSKTGHGTKETKDKEAAKATTTSTKDTEKSNPDKK